MTDDLIERLRVKCSGSGEMHVCCHPDVDDSPVNHRHRACVLDTGEGAPGCDIATDEKLTSKTACPYWQPRPAAAPDSPTPEEGLALLDRIATQQEAIEELEERCAKAIQGLRNTIGATRSQSIALSYAEAAVRREFGLSKHGQRT